jgi:hypothetical protein
MNRSSIHKSFWKYLPAAILLAITPLLSGCASNNQSNGRKKNDAFAKAEANIGSWTYIPVKGAICRDGSPTGFGVRLQKNAKNLLIYLKGGGSCRDSLTCSRNPSHFNAGDFQRLISKRGGRGILSTVKKNPAGGWNMIFIPNCTGDLDGGSASNVSVPGVKQPQQFVGARNIKRYLKLLKPYFKNPGKVLVCGTSAGGFGTLLSFYQFADAFDHSGLYLIDDSGPIFFSDSLFSPAFQQRLISLWNLNKPFPKDAAMLFKPDGLPEIYHYYAARYPNAAFGLISYTKDKVIRFNLSHSQPDQPPITGEEYYRGLLSLRAHLPKSWGTYYAAGSSHTIIAGNKLYHITAGGDSLYIWVKKLLQGMPVNAGS